MNKHKKTAQTNSKNEQKENFKKILNIKLKCKLPKGGLRTSQKQKIKKNVTQKGERSLKENTEEGLGMTEMESVAATQTA
jgi:CRISPR/Cas system CMR-associated protein Cmr5 small subunit